MLAEVFIIGWFSDKSAHRVYDTGNFFWIQNGEGKYFCRIYLYCLKVFLITWNGFILLLHYYIFILHLILV